MNAWAICYTDRRSWARPYTFCDSGRVYADDELDSAKVRLKQLHALGYTDCFIVRLEKYEMPDSVQEHIRKRREKIRDGG